MPMTGRATVSEALKTILICVDSYEDMLMTGEVYHNSLSSGKRFSNLMQLLFVIDEILNDIGFPKASMEKRRFTAMENSSKGGSDGNAGIDFQTKTGRLATFKLKVMFRQNASWQGCISWIEGNSEEPFRSALEMIMLVDSALADSRG